MKLAIDLSARKGKSGVGIFFTDYTDLLDLGDGTAECIAGDQNELIVGTFLSIG